MKEILFLITISLKGLGNFKVKLPYAGWPGTWYKSPLDPHDTLLFDLSIDPGEKNNIFELNKKQALILIEKMKKNILAWVIYHIQ